MRPFDLCLIRPHARLGDPSVRLGVPLLDEYPRFLAGRCRPNTVLAAAYDLKVFFTVVGKEPQDVQPADVLAFVSAQRSGLVSIGAVVQPVGDDQSGVSAHGAASVVQRFRAVRVPARPRRCAGEPGAAWAADPPGTAATASGRATRAACERCRGS